MGRKKLAITIDGQRLRELVLRRTELNELAKELELSRQAVSGWFSSNEIPPKRLSELVRITRLSGPEVMSLSRKKEASIFYRTLRNTGVPDNVKEGVRNLAQDVLSLFKGAHPTPSKNTLTLPTPTPKTISEMAEYIRKQLELPTSGISLEILLNILEKKNVPVFFIDFPSELRKGRIHAFTVQEESLRLVFVDTDCPCKDATFRILHELCHIFSQHTQEVTNEDEVFCNAVATELIYPNAYLTALAADIKKVATNGDFRMLLKIASYIERDRCGSLLGVVIALDENKIIRKTSDGGRYLLKVAQVEKAKQQKIEFYTSPESNSADSWNELLDDPNLEKFNRLYLLLKDGILDQRLSARKAAELFHVDVMTIERLKGSWTESGKEVSAN